MNESPQRIVKHVIGLDGCPLTIADLPLPDTKRWMIRRKAEVVAAVRGGLLPLEEVCNRYAVNAEEFLSWQNCIDRFSPAGLRVTRIQSYAPHRRRAQQPARQPASGRRLAGCPQQGAAHAKRPYPSK
jgi:hypothetical protein